MYGSGPCPVSLRRDGEEKQKSGQVRSGLGAGISCHKSSFRRREEWSESGEGPDTKAFITQC